MKTGILPSESALLAIFIALLALAMFGPALAQPAMHHAFADHRGWLGIPCAADVLSNLPFALWGIAGFVALRRVPTGAIGGTQRAMAALFFGGLAVTAVCSSWYHLRPDDAGLLVDRLGMVLAFAGLLGLAVADRVSARAGSATGVVVLLLGAASAFAWAASGNVLPWAVVQFGGMLLVCGLALRKRVDGALGIRLGLVIAIYALAKLFELGDHAVYDLTGGLVSGHSLKHVAAAFAAWPVFLAVKGKPAAGARHNRVEDARIEGPGIEPRVGT